MFIRKLQLDVSKLSQVFQSTYNWTVCATKTIYNKITYCHFYIETQSLKEAGKFQLGTDNPCTNFAHVFVVICEAVRSF